MLICSDISIFLVVSCCFRVHVCLYECVDVMSGFKCGGGSWIFEMLKFKSGQMFNDVHLCSHLASWLVFQDFPSTEPPAVATFSQNVRMCAVRLGAATRIKVNVAKRSASFGSIPQFPKHSKTSTEASWFKKNYTNELRESSWTFSQGSFYFNVLFAKARRGRWKQRKRMLGYLVLVLVDIRT